MKKLEKSIIERVENTVKSNTLNEAQIEFQFCKTLLKVGTSVDWGFDGFVQLFTKRIVSEHLLHNAAASLIKQYPQTEESIIRLLELFYIRQQFKSA